MTKRRNIGNIVGNTYRKFVSFNRAVLWKDKQISIPPDVVQVLLKNKVKWVEFIDPSKNEVWKARFAKIIECWEFKKVGQEPQYYIPIEVFNKKDYKPS